MALPEPDDLTPTEVDNDRRDLQRRAQAVSREAETRYTDAVVAGIAATLPVFQSDDARSAFAGEIRDWAYGYSGWREIIDPRYRLADRRVDATRARVQKAAAELISAYRAHSTTDPLGGHHLTLGQDWEPIGPFETASEAERTLLDLVLAYVERWARPAPTPGRDPRAQIARKMAVTALVAIYLRSAGLMPKHYWSEYANNNAGGYVGGFREFCIAALTPIEGADRAGVGIDKLIKKCLASRAGQVNKARKRQVPK